MEVRSQRFRFSARDALGDPRLQSALGNIQHGFTERRRQALDALPEFEQLRAHGTAIRDHAIEHLDAYLERFEQQVDAAGGQVHWARDAAEACAAVAGICRAAGARTVTKGKSMATEEIGLNEHLEAEGFTPVETDLGEYILQLRGDTPSHIIAPAIHLKRDQIFEAFQAHHDPALSSHSDDHAELQAEARRVLRRRFFEADVGITGANFCIAETGSTVIVTNEGNGDLTQCLPRVHVVVAGIDKIVPTLEDTSTLLRLLARSATGQDITVYTTFSSGPRRADDLDGPDEFHVVLLDNGRSGMLGGELQPMLRCIRCGACMNHCPVYGAIGGHAYGWVYPGPMGAVLTPQMVGIERSADLPNASTFCGRCAEVCPVGIPLPDLMRYWREREYEGGHQPAAARWGLGLWARVAVRPRLYHALARLGARILGRLGHRRGRLARLPLAGGWTRGRDLPAPVGRTFTEQWRGRAR
ncbi:MAG: LutB/LldF family L-lactate oxidation iron-sulfur protein [Halofilum sp. (in: g-proteobacteria)]|nr:LutB/LldF family L-lactate oxidation iron-sulfur protein [Halofilum sp. (in: g-proteobacteria)]